MALVPRLIVLPGLFELACPLRVISPQSDMRWGLMRKFLFASVLMFLPLAAIASPTAVIGSYTVQYTPGVGNSPQIQKIFSDPFTLNLTPGVPTSATKFLAV